MQGLHFETPWYWISYGYQLFRWYESHPKCHIEAFRKWTAMKGFRVPSVSLATSSVHRGSPRARDRICTVNWNLKFLTPQESWSNSDMTYSPMPQYCNNETHFHQTSIAAVEIAGRSSTAPNQRFGVCLPRPSSKPNCFATNAARLACYKISLNISWLRLQRGGPFLWVLLRVIFRDLNTISSSWYLNDRLTSGT